MELTGKTILITGASSGLGRGLAEALGRQDNNLVLTARRHALLEEVAEIVRASGSRCLVVPADATDPDASQAVIDAALETYGCVDLAVLNAGGGDASVMGVASAAQVRHTMRVNYDTLVNFLCPLIEHMRQVGGTIAYTGSPAGYFGLPKSGPYSAAKAAGRILIDTCRIELADTPIRFVALYPGFTDTPGLDNVEVPIQALIIDIDRAVAEMLGAIERGDAHHMFPKRISWVMALARCLPEPVRRFILRRV